MPNIEDVVMGGTDATEGEPAPDAESTESTEQSEAKSGKVSPWDVELDDPALRALHGDEDDEDDDESDDKDGEGAEAKPEGDEEGKEDEPPAPIALDDLADDHVIKVGEEEITAKDLRDSRLRHGDYTKKTMALADKERDLEAKAAESEQKATNLVAFVESFEDSAEMSRQLQEHFPKAFHDAAMAYATEQYQVSQMEPEARFQYMENIREQRDRRTQSRADQQQQQQNAQQQQQQWQETRKKEIDGWVPEAMGASGLIQQTGDKAVDEKHNLTLYHFIQERIAAKYAGVRPTREQIHGMAVEVADMFGAAKAQTATAKQNGNGKKAPKRKPKAPPSAKPTSSAAPKPKTQSQSMGEFFDSLRR